MWKFLYIIFACTNSLLVPLEILLYMLRTGRHWTLIFSLTFFSVQMPSSTIHWICFSLLLKASRKTVLPFLRTNLGNSCWSRGGGQLTPCGTATKDFSKHHQQHQFLGVSWTPVKSPHTPVSLWLWSQLNEVPDLPGFELETQPFFYRGKKELYLWILFSRKGWRGERRAPYIYIYIYA